jgi:hypothetical protein
VTRPFGVITRFPIHPTAAAIDLDWARRRYGSPERYLDSSH